MAEEIGTFTHDPLAYVMYAFPWGEGELAGYSGPRKWQREYLERLGRRLKALRGNGYAPILEAVCSGHGVGKAQNYSLKLDTPRGRMKWGDIFPGDELFGSDGMPVRVLSRHEQGVRPIYRVRFSDGSETFADAEHLWLVRGRHQRRNGIAGWVTLTTAELLRRGVKRPNGDAMARQWEIPTCKPVHFGDHWGRLEIPPYVLGVWLGDGSKRDGRVTNCDQEVWDELGEHYELGNVQGIGTRTLYDLKPQLRRLWPDGAKTHTVRIPEQYKCASPEDRLALLQGLLDTDGWVEHNGQPSFASTSYGLVCDVVWLARSLGLQARVREHTKHPFYYDADGNKVICRDAWNAGITWDGKTRLFRLKRKQEKLTPAEARYQNRWIDSIEYSHDERAMCVTVDAPDHAYLTNDFIVTHNTALTAWIILWALSTCRDTRGVVTAGTDAQLKTKTWPELAKWHRLAVNRDWFTFTATSIHSSIAAHEKTWRFDALPWSENRSEAFAGLHNKGRRAVAIFDEASQIPNTIWEVTFGALTDAETELLMLPFGNPTKNTGMFRECFGRMRHRWSEGQPLSLDSRDVEGTNKALFNQWVEDYGEDSDFVRVRVKGMFPRASSLQFIDSELVAEAMKREERYVFGDPLVMSMDVARGGEDSTVIMFRRGNDARSIRPVKIPGYECRDSMKVVSVVVELLNKYKPDVFFYDDTGVGGPVGDRVRQLGYRVWAVNFGAASPDPHYANMRAYIWGRLREALRNGLAIESDPALEQDLTGVEYGHNKRDQLLLESKEDMKKRGLASPDSGDALALTVAAPVAIKGGPGFVQKKAGGVVGGDADPYEEMNRV